MINIKKLLCVLFISFECSAMAAFDRGTTYSYRHGDSKSLALYKLLTDAEADIFEDDCIDEKNEILKLIDDLVSLLKTIMANLENSSDDVVIRTKFVSLCNALKKSGIDSFKPHDLRRIIKKIIVFDLYIHKYFANRNKYVKKDGKSESARQTNLSEMLYKFDEKLMLFFSKNECFDIGFSDHVVDWIVYRPLELARIHPKIVTTLFFVIIVAMCFYLYKRCPERKGGSVATPTPQSDSTTDLLSGSNPISGVLTVNPKSRLYPIPDGAIVKSKSNECQKGLRCGKHALINLWCEHVKSQNGGKLPQDFDALKSQKEAEWTTILADKLAYETSDKKETEFETTCKTNKERIDRLKKEKEDIEAELGKLPRYGLLEFLFGYKDECADKRQPLETKLRDVNTKLSTMENNLENSKKNHSDLKELVKSSATNKTQLFENMPEEWVTAIMKELKISTAYCLNAATLKCLTETKIKPEELDKHVEFLRSQSTVAAIINYINILKDDSNADIPAIDGVDAAIWTYLVKPFCILCAKEKVGEDQIKAKLESELSVAGVVEKALLKDQSEGFGGNENQPLSGEDKSISMVAARKKLWENGDPMFFIVNTAMNIDGTYSGFRHYIMYKAYKQDDVIKLAYYDSMGGNYNSSNITAMLYDFVKKQ